MDPARKTLQTRLAHVNLNTKIVVIIVTVSAITLLFQSSLYLPTCFWWTKEIRSRHDRFKVIWHGHSSKCSENWGISLPFEKVGILANEPQEWNGQYVSIFYKNMLGYPYVVKNKITDIISVVRGGIPQVRAK